MSKLAELNLTVVYRGNPIDSEIVKEILSENGIMVNLKNQLMGSIAPWQVSSGGLDPVEVEVMGKDRKKALELIGQFNKSS